MRISAIFHLALPLLFAVLHVFALPVNVNQMNTVEVGVRNPRQRGGSRVPSRQERREITARYREAFDALLEARISEEIEARAGPRPLTRPPRRPMGPRPSPPLFPQGRPAMKLWANVAAAVARERPGYIPP
ncbi:hypothetical protein FA15DRAFT_672633 [Coprinopsis marcescibilis]|uniref:Uncharacterized protein n=1 Tax=Coprinopsis marcescibilis TaxID=230819 RepID=A0A5C3KZJ6_COPMA|nr:hypothetical protein FA15DRAFT_672633 [Coprinopsis marcescibilis]